MSALTKVSFLTEIGLSPLRRFTQPDNYQEAARKYTDQLRDFYQLSLGNRRQLLLDQKQAVETETFSLNHKPGGALSGITIDRDKLPQAELGDEILLINQDHSNDSLPQILSRGVVTKLADQKLQIKLDGTIIGQKKARPTQTSEAVEELENEDGAGNQDKEDEAECLTLNFKLKFALGNGRGKNLGRDDYSTMVEAALANFKKLKCNQAIQRILLGLYDERADSLSEKSRVMSFKELVPKLNGQQRAAIEHALKRRLTLVEGPAGTGKTIVAAHIAANAARQRRARVLVCSPIQETVDKLTELVNRVGGLRVVKFPATTQSPTCGAARSSRPTAHPERRPNLQTDSASHPSNHCLLEKLVEDEIYLQAYSRFKDNLGDSKQMHELAYRVVTLYPENRRRQLEARLISKADVVCCTFNSTASKLLKSIEFDMLILDDVQVTSELDCLLAIMTKGIKQVILLSDTRREIRLSRIPKRSQSVCNTANNVNNPKQQLPNHSANSLRKKQTNSKPKRQRQISTVSDSITLIDSKFGLSRATSVNSSKERSDLFERFLSLGVPTVDLRIQYRCHKTLSHFVSHHFYAGRLKNDPVTDDKMSIEIATRLVIDDESFSWLPNKEYLTAIYKVSTSFEGNDVRNELERQRLINDKVLSLVEKLSSASLQKFNYNIGVIYNRPTRVGPSQTSTENIKFGTINHFVGQECDFVILVAGKNLEADEQNQTNVGICSTISCDFRKSDTTLNWALTRARLGLFLVLDEPENTGGSDAQDQIEAPLRDDDCKSWRELVNYYAAHSLVVE